MAGKGAKLMRKRLASAKTALLVCDLQEKFRSRILGFDAVVESSRVLIAGCQALDMPVVVTEQYPKALGYTVPELGVGNSGSNVRNVPIFSKTRFSMMCPEVENELKNTAPGIESVLLCGIESHVCVYQTAMDLIDRGIDVHVVVDAVSSQRDADRSVGIASLQALGCSLSTVEMALFEMLGDSHHPTFKAVSNIIKGRDTSQTQLSFAPMRMTPSL